MFTGADAHLARIPSVVGVKWTQIYMLQVDATRICAMKRDASEIMRAACLCQLVRHVPRAAASDKEGEHF